MSQTLQLSVEKVQFKITPKGNLFPLISFNTTKELDKMGIDSIAMPDINATLHHKIGKGARLKVEFQDESLGYQPEIKEVVKTATRSSELPSICPSCTNPLTSQGTQIMCLNVFCAGQSRGMIYKMFRLVDNTIKNEEITDFLDNYTDGTIGCNIDTIGEFKLLFSQIPNKDTQSREGNWLKTSPETGARLWEIERKINDFLHSDKIPSSYFWSICNFPLIEEPTVNEMNKINPKKLLNLEYDLKKMNLSKKAERYLTNNLVFVDFLNNFFEAFGEKEWTN